MFDFLGIEKMEVNAKQKHMVGGWQWENEKIKNVMMKKNQFKSFLKILIPFKGIRKKIRGKLQENNTIRVAKINDKDKEMLKEFYREDVKKLSGLLGRDLNFWTQ